MFIKREEYVVLKTEIASLTARLAALQHEIASMRGTYDGLVLAIEAEKARANTAVDRLLEQKGMGPVTPVKSPTLEELSDMFSEDPDEIASIKSAISTYGATEVLLRSSE